MIPSSQAAPTPTPDRTAPPPEAVGPILGAGAAPGKIILLGEHAVVYGQPALAVPITAVSARAEVRAAIGPLTVVATFPPDAGREARTVDVAAAGAGDPVAVAVREALAAAGRGEEPLPDWRVDLASSVPLGRGLGSSAAAAVALARAVLGAAGAHADDRTVAEVALAAERSVHGTPSGVDTTVVAWGHPIRFELGNATRLTLAAPLHLVIADSGETGSTGALVAAVRARCDQRPGTYGQWFAQIGRLVNAAVRALGAGDLATVGRLMNANHLVLQAMRVSTPRLDALVAAARVAGALGAKLSGAGGGGVVVALAAPGDAEDVARALVAAGAAGVMHTAIEPGA